jgi:tetratricopeptide (TPR) repeat protein
MQVFLLLLDAGGKVVTRNTLFDECWGGAMVGDDSLNRAIGKVRKIAAETAPGFFEVETIPRTGYRLVGEIVGQLAGEQTPVQHRTRFARRGILAGAVAAAGVGSLGFLWVARRDGQAFNSLIALGDDALGYRDPSVNPANFYRRALQLRPGDPQALGRLAYALARMTDGFQPLPAGLPANEAQQATHDALRRDPNDTYAQLASFVLERSTLDFIATEEQLRRILSSAPDNVHAMRHQWEFLTCVGRCRDALAVAERAVAIAPLVAGNQYPRAQLLWIVGRTAEADRVIERALTLWPSHRFVRFARFTILAFTGRARAALAMLGPGKAPQNFTPAGIDLWRESLPAFFDPSPTTIATARAANRDKAQTDLQLASQAVMTLSVLRDVDGAFQIIDALYATDVASGASGQEGGTSIAWRFAPWLFVPPVANVRADPRFKALCDSIGLTDYWAKRGIKPDYQLRRM